MGFKQQYDSLLSKCVRPLLYKLKNTRKGFFYIFFFELLKFSDIVYLTYEETLCIVENYHSLHSSISVFFYYY